MTADTLNVVTTGTMWIIGWQQLGRAIINDSLRWGAVGFLEQTTTPRQAKRVAESVIFLEGSGLDRAVDIFYLELDPAVLRHQYHVWLTQRSTPFHP